MSGNAKNRRVKKRGETPPPSQSIPGVKPGILAHSRAFPTNSNPVLSEDLFNDNETDSFFSGATVVGENDYIQFFNDSSDFVKKVTALINSSPTVRRIVKDKVTLTLGKGFIPHDGRAKNILAVFKKILRTMSLSEDELFALENELCSINLRNESLRTVTSKGLFDFYFIGNAAFELVRTTKEGNPTLYAYHIPFNWVRIKDPKNATKIPEEIGILDDWDKQVQNKDKIRTLPIYPNWQKGANGEQRTAILVQDYAPGLVYYGLPDWIAAHLWAEIEYRIPKYNIGKFKNGYVPSSIVQFFGSTTEEEAKELVDDFIAKFTDTGNNDKIFVQVLRDESYKANVQVLEDKSEGNYLQLSSQGQQMIVTASRWSMSLAGVQSAGELGSNQRIREELEIILNTVIEPVKQKFLNEFVNVFMRERAEVTGQFRDINLTISNPIPISLTNSLNIAQYLSRNEGRDILGFEPIDDERGDFIPEGQGGNTSQATTTGDAQQ